MTTSARKIFVPPGMTSSRTTNQAFKPGDNYARPHSKVDGKLKQVAFENPDNVAPAISAAEDMIELAKGVLLQLNHQKFLDRDGRLFSEQQSREMWSPQTMLPIEGPPPPLQALKVNFAAYGLGWFLSDDHGRKVVAHDGEIAGFVSAVFLLPEENLGIVVFTNAEQLGAFESIGRRVLDRNWNLAVIDWIAAF